MKASLLSAVAVAAIALATACGDQPTETRRPDGAIPALGKGKVDVTTRANYLFADSVNVGTAATPNWVPGAFRGDGRLRDGTPATGSPSNEYQGEFCGVGAVIGSGTKNETADFNYRVDATWSSSMPASCQPARYYLLYLNGPASTPFVTRPHEIASGIATMAPGETRIQSFHSGTLADVGVGLWWDDAYPPASSLRFTRLPDVTDEFGRTVRQWRLETQGTHRAMGVVQDPSGRGSVVTGTTYYLPFAMIVTEVPYPFPTFP